MIEYSKHRASNNSMSLCSSGSEPLASLAKKASNQSLTPSNASRMSSLRFPSSLERLARIVRTSNRVSLSALRSLSAFNNSVTILGKVSSAKKSWGAVCDRETNAVRSTGRERSAASSCHLAPSFVPPRGGIVCSFGSMASNAELPGAGS